MAHEAETGFQQLTALCALSDEGRCHFVLAGQLTDNKPTLGRDMDVGAVQALALLTAGLIYGVHNTSSKIHHRTGIF